MWHHHHHESQRHIGVSALAVMFRHASWSLSLFCRLNIARARPKQRLSSSPSHSTFGQFVGQQPRRSSSSILLLQYSQTHIHSIHQQSLQLHIRLISTKQQSPKNSSWIISSFFWISLKLNHLYVGTNPLEAASTFLVLIQSETSKFNDSILFESRFFFGCQHSFEFIKMVHQLL